VRKHTPPNTPWLRYAVVKEWQGDGFVKSTRLVEPPVPYRNSGFWRLHVRSSIHQSDGLKSKGLSTLFESSWVLFSPWTTALLPFSGLESLPDIRSAGPRFLATREELNSVHRALPCFVSFNPRKEVMPPANRTTTVGRRLVNTMEDGQETRYQTVLKPRGRFFSSDGTLGPQPYRRGPRYTLDNTQHSKQAHDRIPRSSPVIPLPHLFHPSQF